MEAARALQSFPARLRARNEERQLVALRPLGEAYLLRSFSGSLNRADAEDAVSDVLLRLHRQIEAGRGPDNLRAAFFTSVRNAAIDQLRSRAAKPTVGLEVIAEAPAFAPTPLERAESRDEAARLREAMGRMRGNYREALVLRFGLGMTVPEIAEQLDLSLPAAKKLVLRAGAQVRMRLESIESEEFCAEMQGAAQRSLFDKKAAGLATEAEEAILQTHFEHCGQCRTFLSSLHDKLHELGSGALLLGSAGTDQGGHLAIADHLSRWAGDAGQVLQAAGAKLRLSAYKATGAFGPADSGPAGLLAGSGQKLAAICTAGAATTATCFATGIVGPGVGVTAPLPDHERQVAAHVRPFDLPVSEPAPVEPTPAPVSEVQPKPGATADPHPEDSSTASAPAQSTPTPSPEPTPTPSEQSEAQFGFESAPQAQPSPEPAPAAAPTPAPPPSAPSSASSSGGSGSASSGTESFGLGG
jgi:RNA polymerase sigma factor (sigma-70 family)